MKAWLWCSLWIGACQSADKPSTVPESNKTHGSPSTQVSSNVAPITTSMEAPSDANDDSTRTVIYLNSNAEIQIDDQMIPEVRQLQAILNAQRNPDSKVPLMDISPDLRWNQIEPVVSILGPEGSPTQFDIYNRANAMVHSMAWWPAHPGSVGHSNNGSPEHPFTFEINLRSEGLTIRHHSAPQEFNSTLDKASQLVEHAKSQNGKKPIPVLIRIAPDVSWQTVLELTHKMAPILTPGHLAIWHESPDEQ